MELNLNTFIVMLIIGFSCQALAVQNKVPANTTKKLFQHILRDARVTEEKIAEIKAGSASEYISVKPVDLNGDGKPEYIVEGLKPPLMGMLAGYTWIYEKKNGEYVLIGDFGAPENVTPLKSEHNGYRDIKVSLSLNSGQKVVHYKFEFNGNKYVLKH